MNQIFIVIAIDTGEAMNLFASDKRETAEACKKDLELFLEMKKMLDENQSAVISETVDANKDMLVKKWNLKPYELNFLDWYYTCLTIAEIPFLQTAE